jgi:hypothetical protein
MREVDGAAMATDAELVANLPQVRAALEEARRVRIKLMQCFGTDVIMDLPLSDAVEFALDHIDFTGGRRPPKRMVTNAGAYQQ